MDGFFPTSTAVDGAESKDSMREQELESTIARQIEQMEILTRNVENWRSNWDQLNLKILNVKGYLADVYSETGEVSDELKQIAEYLDISLTKSIAGTATLEISWSAQVPLDFDGDDFEISFDVNCESYEAEDFDWNEDNLEVNAEDEY